MDAAKETDFCSTLVLHSDGRSEPKLKQSHPYFYQIQGQLAITGRKWCNFIIYTTVGISVERIMYDPKFWNDQLLPKLIEFYDNCYCPAIVSPVHLLGMKLHDLRVS